MPDLFRKEYRPLNDQEKQIMKDLKEKAEELYKLVGNYYGTLPAGPVQRNLAVFTTNLEQAVMWAVKGITE